MLGRRGPVQAAFTPPELKELGELAGADVGRRCRPTSSSTRRARRSSRPTASARGATTSSCRSTPPARRRASRAGSCCASSSRRWRSSATAGSRRSRSCATSWSRRDGRLVARPTGETETIPAGLVLRSVGYQGVALPGVPFDERGGDDPERARAASTRRRAGLRRRLDQARPERRDRHEQEGRDRDRRAPARGRARGLLEAGAHELDELLAERHRLRRLPGWQAIDAPSAPRANRSAGHGQAPSLAGAPRTGRRTHPVE